MRTILTLIAIVLAVGAGFDLLITLDLMSAERQARSVADYLETGAPLFAWAAETLRAAVPERLLDPVMALPPDWFFPMRALALGLCAAVLFAVVRSRSI
jgi:hypothetical protein